MIAAEFVNFVQHENRIFDFDAAHSGDKAARHRADISAAMAANFGFIVNAAQR